MKVEEWMSEPVHTVGVGSPLADCAATMRSHGIRHLPVVDSEGRLVGLLNDFAFELRGKFLSGLWVPHDDADRWLLAKDAVRIAEVWAHRDDALAVVLGKLHAAYQDCVVVVDDDQRPVGVLTEHDVVRHAIELLPADAPASTIARESLPLVEHDTFAAEARSYMARKRLRHTIVVRRGVLLGVVSYRDVALEEMIEGTAIGDLMRAPVYRSGAVGAREAARVMYDQKIGSLPLVDAHNRPVAVITRREVMEAVIQALPSA